MADDGKVYGIKSWLAWCASKADDLSTEKQEPAKITDEYTHEVTSYSELARVVSFLNVMNKTTSLLFRGQARDYPPVPTLLRARWRPPDWPDRVELGADRRYYYEQLAPLSVRVCEVLAGDLPRHRPFDRHAREPRLRIAPWAVIQHYALWPTPLVDLTSSLRVAAAFALALPARRRNGFVYAYAIPDIVTDLMELDRVPDPITYRLSAVCPPSALRPHLQDGFLIGNSRFGHADLDRYEDPLARRFVAKFRLRDSPRSHPTTFWSKDFPPHRAHALLPTNHDPVADLFRREIHYDVSAGRASWH